jgi:hypothetical protein
MREIGLIILAVMISKLVFSAGFIIEIFINNQIVRLIIDIIFAVISVIVAYKYLIAKQVTHWMIGLGVVILGGMISNASNCLVFEAIKVPSSEDEMKEEISGTTDIDDNRSEDEI